MLSKKINSLVFNYLSKQKQWLIPAFCMIAAWAFVQIAVWSALSTEGAPKMKPEMLELLVTRSMPFGKYQGRIIADLPGDYLAWFARKGFPTGELGGLLALMHEIDHNGLGDLLVPLRKKHGR